MKTNRKPKMIIILSLILMLMIQTTAALIITEPQSIQNTFKPFKFAMNDLLVSKVVEHSYGESYKIPEELAFDFEIDMGIEYADYTFDTTKGEKTTNELGKMNVSLKPGETIYIENIEEGTKVKVTEVQNKPGFTIKDVSVAKDGTISSDETLVVDYTNIYKAEPAKSTNIKLNGIKILEGREWQDGDSFSFTLEYQKPTGEWLPLATKTVTYNSENTEYNKFSFDEDIQVLQFDELGVQSFRLTEIEGTLEDVDYDKTINYFNFVTSDHTMDGQIDIEEVNGYQNITVTEQDGIYNLDVIFNNTYEKIIIEDLLLKLNVLNQVKNIGDYTLSPEGFEYVLVNTDTGEEIKLKTNSEGKLTYDLNYTENDIGKTFNYIIKVINDGKEYVTYTDKEYQVTVNVNLDENNKLFHTIYVDGVETTDTQFEFENIYDKKKPVLPPEDITLNIDIDNIVNNTGDLTITPEGFEYILNNTTKNEKQTTKSDKNGDAKFDITYTAADVGKTYIYELTQTCNAIKGLTCADEKYTIEVTIELTEDNKLVANTKVNNQKVTSVNTKFENTYHVVIIDDIYVDVTIKNEVENTGKYSIGPENFTFKLEELATGIIYDTISDKNGNASFKLKFTEEDIGKTYKYQLSLVPGKMNGLTYSDKKYDIEITISLNENNKLVATITMNGSVLGEIYAEFLNIYHVVPNVPSSPSTVDTSDNASYVRLLMMTAGGLMMLIIMQNEYKVELSFATATNITRLITDPEEPEVKEEPVKKIEKKPTRKRKELTSATNDEIYEMIKAKRNKKTAK